MNAGLLNKSFREAAAVIFGFALGLAIFESFVSYIFWTYQEELTSELLQIEFLQDLINSLVGGQAGGYIGPGTLNSLAWVHPLVLSIVFATEVTLCTRVPAGEIDRGTIDILFALPVSRWRVYVAETVVWLGAGVVLMAFALAGSRIGYLAVPIEDRPEIVRQLIILANLFALYACVGSMSLLISALSDRRGRAIGAIFAILLTLFLWNFVAQYWEPADRVGFLNILSYYKPMPVLVDGAFPVRDVAVLVACALPLWVVGGLVLARRDICTV